MIIIIKELSYNLPGYGFAKCFLIGQAIDAMDLLESNQIIERMQNTCQLGTMRYVYPGAHHTRYEYVFTQLMLISNIASADNYQRNIEVSLSSNLGEYEILGYKLSGSSLMQCLALLSNAGHMYDTFTASKILLRILNESRNSKSPFYTIYKRNLPKIIKKKFDEILLEGNFYKLHLFNAIQILQGFNRSEKNKKICELFIHILTQLIDPDLIKNEATQKVFFLYKKIRKIAYLSVDMIYTPASFGANLSRMIYSISSYVDDLFDDNSAMNMSIQQLENIIHQQIYDSPMCILNSSRIEQTFYNTYLSSSQEIKNIFQLRMLLLENGKNNAMHSRIQPKEIHKMGIGSTLLLSKEWKHTDKYDMTYESEIAMKLPFSRIAYGTQPAQNFKKMYTAYGLLSSESVLSDVQIIIRSVLNQKMYDDSNHLDIVRYAIKSIYDYDQFFFNMTSPKEVAINDCVFIGNGCKTIATKIRNYFSKNMVTDQDALHEILSCADILDSINYSGAVICFVGGIKVSKKSKTQKIDELDGFIYFPNRSRQDGFAYIIEAKNYSCGEKDAEKQLKNTCDYLNKDLTTEIIKKNKCAFMIISEKKLKT